MRIALTIIAILLLMTSCSMNKGKETEAKGGPSPEGYYSVSKNGFTLLYKISEDRLLCILSGPTTGWLALGIAPTSMMRDADFIIGYVSEDEGFIRDDYGIEYTEHREDESMGGTSDVTLHSFDESKTATTLVFSLPLASGDRYDKVLLPGNSYKVIFGAGPKDDFDSYHKSYGSAYIQL